MYFFTKIYVRNYQRRSRWGVINLKTQIIMTTRILLGVKVLYFQTLMVPSTELDNKHSSDAWHEIPQTILL